MPDPFKYPPNDSWWNGEHLDIDPEPEFRWAAIFDRSPPRWWAPDSEACDHDISPKLFRHAPIREEDTGETGGAYAQYECTLCGERWCDRVEEWPPSSPL